MNDIFDNMFVQQGWQCPICRRVYSPSTVMCLYCGHQTTITTTTTTKIDEVTTIDKSDSDTKLNIY